MQDFISEWRKCHHPLMVLGDDAAFYRDTYKRLRDIAARSAKHMNNASLLYLTMYVENTVSIGLNGVYERMYRSVGDVVGYWCRAMGVAPREQAHISDFVSEAVAQAPADGSLRRWMEESIRSCDFTRLEDVAHFLAFQDKTPGFAYPDLRFREEAFTRLGHGDRKTARRMVRSDMAFNWRDKGGGTLLQRLAERFEKSSLCPSAFSVVKNLQSIRPQRLDAYLSQKSKEGNTWILVNRQGEVFENVVLPTPFFENPQQPCFIGQLATYLGKTYAHGPGIWRGREVYDRWDGERWWWDIEESEREEAMRSTFITPFGKEMSLYEDLYEVPEDPGAAHYADFGIHLDEPNIFDVLQWFALPVESEG